MIKIFLITIMLMVSTNVLAHNDHKTPSDDHYYLVGYDHDIHAFIVHKGLVKSAPAVDVYVVLLNRDWHILSVTKNGKTSNKRQAGVNVVHRNNELHFIYGEHGEYIDLVE